MNADPQAGPWMPRIQQLAKLGTEAFSSLVVQRGATSQRDREQGQRAPHAEVASVASWAA
jgi:hypothetical protein